MWKQKGQVPFKASTELLYKSLIYLVYDYIKSNDDWHYILCFHSWCWCALCVVAWNCLIFSSKDLSYWYIPLWYWQDNDLYHLCLPKEISVQRSKLCPLASRDGSAYSEQNFCLTTSQCFFIQFEICITINFFNPFGFNSVKKK